MTLKACSSVEMAMAKAAIKLIIWVNSLTSPFVIHALSRIG